MAYMIPLPATELCVCARACVCVLMCLYVCVYVSVLYVTEWEGEKMELVL